MTMTFAEESAMIEAAGAELRKRGLTGTARHVALVMNAARGATSVTAAELHARTETMLENGAQQADPFAGREVAALLMTPRNPDGSGGEVVKVIRSGKRQAQQYAPTAPFVEPRLTDSKRIELEAEANGIRAQLASAGLTPSQTIRLQQSLEHLERILGKTGSGDAVDPQYR